MKKLAFVIAACAALAVSCRSNSSTQNTFKGKIDDGIIEDTRAELTQEVQEMLDGIAGSYNDTDNNGLSLVDVITANLTDKQKLVKPDYLLEPERVQELVSYGQKVNALAILASERPVRLAYGMSVTEVDAEIAKLLTDVNHPVDIETLRSASLPEMVKKTYEACKEADNLCYYWLFCLNFENSLMYLLSHNVDTFFDGIDDTQYIAFNNRRYNCIKAARKLSEYDSYIASALELYDMNRGDETDEAEFVALKNKEAGRRRLIEKAPAIQAAREQSLL